MSIRNSSSVVSGFGVLAGRRAARVAALAVAVAAVPAFGQALDGTLSPGEYPALLALQTTATGFGNLSNQLDSIHARVTSNGSVGLFVAGNLEGNGNPYTLLLDNGRGGGIASRNPDGSGNAGNWFYIQDFESRYVRRLGTNNGVRAGSVFAPGFDPRLALTVNLFGTSFYTNVIELFKPGNDTTADYYLGEGGFRSASNTPANPTITSNYANYGPDATYAAAFDNSNAIIFDNGSPTQNTKGYEVELSAAFARTKPGTQMKVLTFINGGSGDFLSNQFLPGLAPGTGNLGNPADPAPMFDWRNNQSATFVTIPTPTNTTGTSWFDNSGWSTQFAPNGTNTQAAIDSGASARTVAVNGNPVVGTLYLSGAGGVTLTESNSGGADLKVRTFAGDTAVIRVTGGAHSAQLPVRLESNTSIEVAAGASLAFRQLDVGTSAALFRGGDIAALRAAVKSYIDTGTNGITSAALDANTIVAVFPNSTTNGAAYYDSFGGSPLAAADVVVRRVYKGDTNIDGVVDARDLVTLLEGLSTGATGWQNGDLDYSGSVTNTDYATLLNILGLGLPSLGGPVDTGVAPSGAVPEPTSVALLLAAAPLLARRRR